MVKCCSFIIGLALVIGGGLGLYMGVYNTWYFARLDPGVLIGPVLLTFGILLLYMSNKWENDESRARWEAEKRKEEAIIQKEKEKFLREKQWEKELDIKYCSQCGNVVKSGQGFCVSCGNPIN